MNEAKEHGFGAEDKWTLIMVSDTERARIKKDYYPVVANKLLPDDMLKVFRSVKTELHQSLSKEESLMDTMTVLNEDLNYIIAFNPKRFR
ncbi:MAG TPA: hypothetical protein VFE53_12790 [Mucilaginibacter sp.]|nr:hypothetical protein [Mucilaginibacter sp.]